MNSNCLRMSLCDFCHITTQGEGEFRGGAIHSEKLSVSFAWRDEATDHEPVPIAHILTVACKKILEVLAFLSCHSSVAAKSMFVSCFSMHHDYLGWAFLSAKPTFYCSNTMKLIADN